jgi:hypothetical protein
MVVAVEPVMIFSPSVGKNVPVALAIVSLDSSMATLRSGDIGTVYSQSLIMLALLGALVLVIIYRLTLKPFEVLREDIDKGLGGELAKVTHEFKMSELNGLWDVINTAIQRLPKDGDSGAGDGQSTKVDPQQFVGPIEMMASTLDLGAVVFGADRNIAYLSPKFEEITGIRASEAIGQGIEAVSLAQSLTVLVQSLFGSVTPGGKTEDRTEFSGVPFKVCFSAFGESSDPSPKGYVMVITRIEE